MPYITDAQLADRVASMLHKVGGGSALVAAQPEWSSIIADANVSAYNEIQSALKGRGFPATVIDAWDRRIEYNVDLGLYWALVRGAGLHQYDPTYIDKLDRRTELSAVGVLVDGGNVPTVPGATGGKISHGRMSSEADMITWRKSWWPYGGGCE